jgi:hypothetical protein
MAGAVPPTELILAASSNRVGQTPNERRVARDVERTPDRDAGRCSQARKPVVATLMHIVATFVTQSRATTAICAKETAGELKMLDW